MLRFAARLPGPPARDASRQLRFTSTAPYAATLHNLQITRQTRVLFQGFTGRQATANARASLAWGTNIVGGVITGRSGHHLGLPVHPTVRAAVDALRPHATAICVPAEQAPRAIEDAVAAEVPLVVALAEHVPLHAMLRIADLLKTQSASRLVGPNSPGIVSALHRCRIGFQPLACFQPDDAVPLRVGLASRSGTLSYEAVASTTRAGLGQSLCIGVGGDLVVGTDLCESLTLLARDPDTHAIALIGEIGGASEIEAADWIRTYLAREPNPKPIVALVAGTHAVPGRMMGHAGAFCLPGEPDAQEKIRALRNAGATIVDHPEQFGAAIRARLQSSSSPAKLDSPFSYPNEQRRGLHKAASEWPHRPVVAAAAESQKRTVFLSQDASFNFLREHNINAGEESTPGPRRYLAITVDRSARSPCVLAASDQADHSGLRRFHFTYHPSEMDGFVVDHVAAHLQLARHPHAADSLRHLLRQMYAVFVSKQAFLVETTIMEHLAGIKVVGARVGIEKAGEVRDADEAAARQNGIVHVKLADADAAIGILSNGAGLAMNTVDALAAAGGKAANFLDTGGLATDETIRTCFELLLRDPRVRVVFVNVFGGLVLGDTIARGILLAFQQSKVRVPVVVRLRGTNEEEGQRIIRESGLPLFVFDRFEDAAAKAIELAAEK